MDTKIIQIMPLVGWYAVYKGGEQCLLIAIPGMYLEDNGNVGFLDYDSDGFVDADPHKTGGFVGVWHKSDMPEEYRAALWEKWTIS